METSDEFTGTTINFAAAVKAVELAVAYRGKDYVYSSPAGCVNVRVAYTATGEQIREMGCLVGTAAILAGWHTLASCPPTGDAVRLTNEAEDHDLRFTRKATRYLLVAQKLQDSKATWGEAAARALVNDQVVQVADVYTSGCQWACCDAHAPTGEGEAEES